MAKFKITGLPKAQTGGTSGCPDGQYFNGTDCVAIPKGAKVVYTQEEYDRLNTIKKEQQRLYNEYIQRMNTRNAITKALKQKHGNYESGEKFYKTFESIPRSGFNPLMSYGPASLVPDGLGEGIPSMKESMIDFKKWQAMMNQSGVKPIGFRGHPGGGHFYPVYEKPSDYVLGYEKPDEDITLEVKPIDTSYVSNEEPIPLNLGVPDFSGPNIVRVDNIEEDLHTIKQPIYDKEPVYGYRPDGSAYIKDYKKVFKGYQDIQWRDAGHKVEPTVIDLDTGTPTTKYKKGGIPKAQIGGKPATSLLYSPYEQGMFSNSLHPEGGMDPSFILGVERSNVFPTWGYNNDVRSSLSGQVQFPYAMNQAPGVKGRWTSEYSPNAGERPVQFTTTGQLEGGYNPDQGFNASMVGWPHIWGSNVDVSRWRNAERYYPGAFRAGIGPQLGGSYMTKAMTTSGDNDIATVSGQTVSKAGLNYGGRGYLEYTPTDWLKLRLDAQAMFDPLTKKVAEGTQEGSAAPTEQVKWKFSPGVQLSATVPIKALTNNKKKASEEKIKIDAANADANAKDIMVEAPVMTGPGIDWDYRQKQQGSGAPVGHLPGYEPETGRQLTEEELMERYGQGPRLAEGGTANDIYLDLDDNEIEQYKLAGYVVEELPQAQFGRSRGKIGTQKVKKDKSSVKLDSDVVPIEQPTPQFGMQQVMTANCLEGHVWDPQTQSCIPFQNVTEATVYGNPEKAKEQGRLFNQLAEMKRAFKNTFIEEGYGGKELDLPDKGSIAGLKHNIQLYKKNLELEKQRTEKAKRALTLLQKNDSETWGNKKVKDVLNGPEAIEALRDMYDKGDITYDNFMNYYKNFGQATDQNVIEGGRGQAYSAKDAQDEWGRSQDWQTFMNNTHLAAALIPTIPALIATGLGSAIYKGVGSLLNYAPFSAAPWLNANSILIPQFAYDALRENGDFHTAYKQAVAGNYGDAAWDATMGAVGVLPYYNKLKSGLKTAASLAKSERTIGAVPLNSQYTGVYRSPNGGGLVVGNTDLGNAVPVFEGVTNPMNSFLRTAGYGEIKMMRQSAPAIEQAASPLVKQSSIIPELGIGTKELAMARTAGPLATNFLESGTSGYLNPGVAPVVETPNIATGPLELGAGIAPAAEVPQTEMGPGNVRTLKSLMQGSTLRKQVNNKTGQITVQAIRQIANSSGTRKADKVILNEVLDDMLEETPDLKSVNFDDFYNRVNSNIPSLDYNISQYGYPGFEQAGPGLSLYGLTPDASYASGLNEPGTKGLNLGADQLYTGWQKRAAMLENEQIIQNNESRIRAEQNTIEKMKLALGRPDLEESILNMIIHRLPLAEEEVIRLQGEIDEATKNLEIARNTPVVGDARTLVWRNEQGLGTGNQDHFADDPFAIAHSRVLEHPDHPDSIIFVESQSDFAQKGSKLVNSGDPRHGYQKVSDFEYETDRGKYEQTIQDHEARIDGYKNLIKEYELSLKDPDNILDPEIIKTRLEDAKQRLLNAKNDLKNYKKNASPTSHKQLLAAFMDERQIQEEMDYAVSMGKDYIMIPDLSSATKIQGYPLKSRRDIYDDAMFAESKAKDELERKLKGYDVSYDFDSVDDFLNQPGVQEYMATNPQGTPTIFDNDYTLDDLATDYFAHKKNLDAQIKSPEQWQNLISKDYKDISKQLQRNPNDFELLSLERQLSNIMNNFERLNQEIESIKANPNLSAKDKNIAIMNLQAEMQRQPEYTKYLNDWFNVKEYEKRHQPIVKRTKKKVELYKSLLGLDVVPVQVNGNTFFKIRIPESYKQGKAEIQAYKKGGNVDKLKKFIG